MLESDNKKKSSHFFKRVSNYIDQRENTLVNRQKLYVLCHYTAVMAFFTTMGIIATLTGFYKVGAGRYFFLYLSMVFLPVIILAPTLYFKRKISLETAFMTNFIASQLMLSIQLVVSSFTDNPCDIMDMVKVVLYDIPMFLNVTLSIVAFQRRCAIYLAVLSSATVTFHALNSQIELFIQLFPFAIIMFMLMALLGERVTKATYRISNENIQLKEDEGRLFKVLSMDKQDVMTFVELAEANTKKLDQQALLQLFDNKSRRHVVESVQRYLAAKQMQQEDIQQKMPELTPSELEVARLVMTGMKLGEICGILNKTESNVSSIRYNIRKKMNLQADDDLVEKLKERLK